MLHPAMAHFAVSLPIISLILGAAYLYKPTELMSKISTRFFVFAAIFLVAAFFSGKHDGGEVYMFISGEGQKLLVQHKNLGIFLAITMGIAALVKFYGCKKKNFKIEIFSIILVAIVAGGVLYQGKMGGELTYTYGAHVEKHSDGMDCLDDPEEFIVQDD
ncbi:DUF2231 domain-containing protein [Sulfurimonas lithotrophica]|uniref:DUF2231 domain-containing protein n=1 Tax=Sulfurimonas lithotrophica TaxID=2590022 RepID=A0A5P8P2F5_9BACT|nr:DUF2231 domain-containing protein [Sulfurimonas lithotrophica]QFR49846.1 DUF2231 domain-containing protein [Sulfurimonas lithotrophica]